MGVQQRRRSHHQLLRLQRGKGRDFRQLHAIPVRIEDQQSGRRRSGTLDVRNRKILHRILEEVAKGPMKYGTTLLTERWISISEFLEREGFGCFFVVNFNLFKARLSFLSGVETLNFTFHFLGRCFEGLIFLEYKVQEVYSPFDLSICKRLP